MSDQSKVTDRFVSLIKKAVGLPGQSSSCCGSAALPGSQPSVSSCCGSASIPGVASSCCDPAPTASSTPADQKPVASCCGSTPDPGSTCCG